MANWGNLGYTPIKQVWGGGAALGSTVAKKGEKRGKEKEKRKKEGKEGERGEGEKRRRKGRKGKGEGGQDKIKKEKVTYYWLRTKKKYLIY